MVLRVNDFETVREWLRISPSVSPYAERALDRIEAEVERLQRVLRDADAELEAEREARPKLQAEAARLRADLQEMCEAVDEGSAEVERLRAALEQIAAPERTTHVQAVAIVRAALAKEEA